MGLISAIFHRAPIQGFAQQLATEITKRYPPALDNSADKRPSVNRLTRIVEDAAKKAQTFQAEHKLGWLGKAQLGNAFRWKLQELGYKKDFVDLATEAVIVYISKK
jgi:hypothetical protein